MFKWWEEMLPRHQVSILRQLLKTIEGIGFTWILCEFGYRLCVFIASK
jgi:hypothetical protein